MNKTSISWTDYTSNPIRARNLETGKTGHFCIRVSEGCKNCYASEWNEKRYGTALEFTVPNREKVEVYLDEKELAEWSKPKYAGQKVFVCDMSDLFGEWVPDHMIARVWMAMARSLATFQVLTKRPQRMREWATRWVDLEGETSDFKGVRGPEATRAAHPSGRGQIFADYLEGLGPPPEGAAYPTFDWMEGPRWWPRLPLSNVWLGTSTENQHAADERIPVLLDMPASVRFISYEPALGSIDLNHVNTGALWDGAPLFSTALRPAPLLKRASGLDWVIVGGESGYRRRPMDLAWIESTVRQCREAGVAVWVKQDNAPHSESWGRIPEELRVREFPREAVRVG